MMNKMLNPANATRYQSEVVYKTDLGIWRVLPLPDLPEEQVRQLATKEYGVRPEWIRQVRWTQLPTIRHYFLEDPYTNTRIYLPNEQMLPFWDDEENRDNLQFTIYN